MKAKALVKSLRQCTGSRLLNDFEVRGVSGNSKDILDGFIFVAVKGNRFDGNAFVREAITRGAGVVVSDSSVARGAVSSGVSLIKVRDARKALATLASEFYGKPSAKVKVVGITGTNGKTTITYLIESIVSARKSVPAVIGTINYRFKGKAVSSKNTTPGPLELQSMLATMHREGVNYLIMEVSSHALDQDRTEGIRFHSGIFTNLTQDHLDYHRTLGNYFKAKAKLFKDMDARSFAVINTDDRYGKTLTKLTRARLITYGIKNNADVSARDIRANVEGTECKVVTPKGNIHLKTHLIGIHNVYNILAAVAWGVKEGIPLRTIRTAIEKFALVPGRLERIDSRKGFSVFVDYAHTDDALKNILVALRNLTKGRIIVVFGCGGERDKTKRPKMGRVVSALADCAIITNDNPRSEDPAAIIRDITRGIKARNYSVIPQRDAAIRKSLSLANAGDVVVVAGKGHETYQIMKGKTVHFDDREVVRRCLRSMS